ncbi:hypothetical protein BOTNAR_0444g00110 [Botryotinia narcissicola]|uniref:Uncharacterized protein n=1 Tax=Botryotinia narcissicola TaxID=278944 RepID=A0A4Z1HJ75_9HELO|nr:hypothetical protein BOTNAR_0444g00110 [Botryotinia narcissicola]
MRSLFSRSPDLEGGQNRSTYKKGFTGDHRGRTHIPPNPSPLFSPHAQHSPFSVPSASYKQDTIFRPPPSPSPKSGTFSEREWGVGVGEGKGNGLVDERSGLDRLDQEQLARLHEYLGVLPARGTGTGTGIGMGTPQSGRRGFSMSDPNDRDRALRISPTSVPPSIPPPAALPTPLSPHSRLKKNLKHQVAEQQFRSNRNGSVGCGCECDVLGDEDKEVHYHTRVFREALRNALGGVQREREFQGVGSGDRDKEKDGDVEGRRPVMQRRGASEGVREGGFTGPMERERKEDVLPRDLKEFLEKYDPRPEDLPDV